MFARSNKTLHFISNNNTGERKMKKYDFQLNEIFALALSPPRLFAETLLNCEGKEKKFNLQSNTQQKWQSELERIQQIATLEKYSFFYIY